MPAIKPERGHGSSRTSVVTARGAARWTRGHPWIFRSDVVTGPRDPGLVRVTDRKDRFLGLALYSPRSEIRLRLLERHDRAIDAEWWAARLKSALERRVAIDANAYRVVHGEGDGLPSLIVDRYDRWLVVQLLSAGLESMREEILQALQATLQPEGILLRNDAPVRRREGLVEEITLAVGQVPERVEVREGPVRYWAAPWSGQKTGAFLDQRPNRIRAGDLTAPGEPALDCFAYHGSFALHMAAKASRVVALDVSEEALGRGAVNAGLNGVANIEWVAADAFDQLRAWERDHIRFGTIVVDPPAFAKSRAALPGALRGYREINLRAMRLLQPGGRLLTASCSHHLGRAEFLRMLEGAAQDSGRRVVLEELLGQGRDHPEVITIPETGYLKGAILRIE